MNGLSESTSCEEADVNVVFVGVAPRRTRCVADGDALSVGCRRHEGHGGDGGDGSQSREGAGHRASTRVADGRRRGTGSTVRGMSSGSDGTQSRRGRTVVDGGAAR